MRAAENEPSQTPPLVADDVRTLTDVIDQMARSAFQRALERRHSAPPYRTIESAQLVPTPPSP